MSKYEKLSCGIVRDLLPSYLEEICTDDTKAAVKEHLTGCRACRQLADAMHDTEFVSERMETSQINYMKKTKRHFLQKGSYAGIALSVFVLSGLFTCLSDYDLNPVPMFYLVLPFLLLITKPLFPCILPPRNMQKRWKILTVCGILFTCCGTFLHLFVLQNSRNWSAQGYGPFHIKPEQTGPFLNRILLAVLFFLAILYLAGIYSALCQKPFCFLYMNIYLTCAFMMLWQSLSLHILSDLSKSLTSLFQCMSIFLLESSVILIFAGIAEKIKKSCR